MIAVGVTALLAVSAASAGGTTETCPGSRGLRPGSAWRSATQNGASVGDRQGRLVLCSTAAANSNATLSSSAAVTLARPWSVSVSVALPEAFRRSFAVYLSAGRNSLVLERPASGPGVLAYVQETDRQHHRLVDVPFAASHTVTMTHAGRTLVGRLDGRVVGQVPADAQAGHVELVLVNAGGGSRVLVNGTLPRFDGG